MILPPKNISGLRNSEGGAMATEGQWDTAWKNKSTVRGKNPNLYRRDAFGNEIYKPAYGTMGNKGWEVDHSKPKSRGGTDSSRNLQAMQSSANRSKGDKYP
jgi:5-methylcytosine-specific restriction endonuclease McrA